MPRHPAAIQGLLARLRDELRHPEFLLAVFIVATLPLEFTKDWFPVQWIEISRLGMVALVIATLARSGITGLRAVPRLPLLAAAAVIAVEVASVALTRWPAGVHDAAGMIAYACFAVAVAQSIDSRPRLALLGFVFVASAVTIAAVGIAQELGNFYIWRSDDLDVLGRRNATFRDPNIMSRFLILGALAGFSLAAILPRGRPGWSAFALAAGLVVIAIGQVTTQSRSGMALAVLMTVAACVVLFRYRRSVVLYAAVYVLSLAIGLFVLPTIFLRTGGIVDSPPAKVVLPPEKVPELTGAARTVLSILPIDATREYLILAGVAMYSDHPVLGVGVGGIEPLMNGPYREFIALDYRGDNPTVLMHTEIIRIAAETGTVGLLAFLIFTAAVTLVAVRRFRHLGQAERVILTAIGLGLGTILLSSQLVGRLYSEPYLWLFLGLLASPALRVREERPDAGSPAPATG
ncbi:MAG TPA: O-antigen ligase family protein [Candidatus Limnocylindrales bacterium]|nr:O-antigen ligase family protein [Candidatus Limnocylindrales bacterium]